MAPLNDRSGPVSGHLRPLRYREASLGTTHTDSTPLSISNRGILEPRDGGGNGGNNGDGNGGGERHDGGNGNDNDRDGDGRGNNGGGNGSNGGSNNSRFSSPQMMSTSASPPIFQTLSVIQSTKIVTSISLVTMTTWIPVTTTIPVIMSQPRKGVEQGLAPLITTSPEQQLQPTSSSLSSDQSSRAARTALPASTGSAQKDKDNDKHDNNGNNGNWKGKDDKTGNKGLDPAAEHALTAVASIGAFVLVCFLAWFALRTAKRSKMKRYGGKPYNGLLGKIRRRKYGETDPWTERSFDANALPPQYERGDANSIRDVAPYLDEKKQPLSVSRSDTRVSQRSLLRDFAPGSVVMVPVEQYAAMSQNQTFSSSTDYNLTLRSRMPDQFYNQSELARQPSDAYDPNQRQVYRASELSSLSSGFGDGELVIVEGPSKPAPASVQLKESNNNLGRFSWMSRRAGERETVYTSSSEDRPSRFRTINSWVNQQTGRITRAAEKETAEGEQRHPMPDIPGQL